MLAAMGCASSRVSSLAVARRPGSSSRLTKASACPLASRMQKSAAITPGAIMPRDDTRRNIAVATNLNIDGQLMAQMLSQHQVDQGGAEDGSTDWLRRRQPVFR